MLTPNHHRTHVNQLRYKNRLLGAFEPAILAQLEPHIKPVNLKHGATICEAGGTLEHAYFPEGGALSLLTVLENGSAIESGNIGREGAFGIFAVMSSRISFSRCVVQVEGPMVRCLLEPLSEAFQSSGQIRELLSGFAETLLSQVQQTVACQALHSTEERLSRCLLTMCDRAKGNILTCTHEFLSLILGANRKSITLAAQSLQTAGLISYRRGSMEVRDRQGLEQASCECYGVVRACVDAFLPHRSAAANEKDDWGEPQRIRRVS